MSDRPPTDDQQFTGFRRWLLAPVLDAISTTFIDLENLFMASLAQLQTAVDRLGGGVASAVLALADQRTKIAALQAAVDAGNVDQAQLSAITASIDAASDAVAQALVPVVQDPDVPAGDVPLPETNPETVPPESVPGSVEAGQPLPDTPQA